jgi:hypothetical protein
VTPAAGFAEVSYHVLQRCTYPFERLGQGNHARLGKLVLKVVMQLSKLLVALG